MHNVGIQFNSTNHSPTHGMPRASQILRQRRPDLIVSKRRLRQTETIRLARENRENEKQNLGFSSRPFVLCGLPVRRPATGCLLHERRNGQFVLQVTGHPSYGLPWGQDRLVPIFLATLAIQQRVRGSPSAALLKCWTPSAGNRADPNTAGA